MTIMRTNQTGGEIIRHSLRGSVLGKSADVNIKLIRNAMFVTAIIVVISVMGKASAHDGFSQLVVNADEAVWVVAER